MKKLFGALAGLAFVFAVAAPASAQSTASGPSSGAGTTAAPTGASPTAPAPKDLDLPIEPPPVKTPPNTPAPPPDDPDKNKGNPGDPPHNGDDKPPTIYGQELKSENDTIFYVLDVSGSMGWDEATYTAPDGSTRSGCRLDRAKAELAKSVMSLPENFKFDMLSYDCGYYPWSDDMVPADAAHKASALAWVDAQNPGGATATGPATAMGLQVKNNKLLVLLTDGAPNCGIGNDDDWMTADTPEAHRRLIKQSNTNGCVINVYGIGATGDFKKFCMDVASDNGGSYTDVR
jgi:hypothetical protein